MLKVDVLLNRVAAGCETSFRQLYEHYAPQVYRTAYRYLDSADVSNDIVQETFSSIWQKREQLTTIANFPAYLATVARNITFQELRRWSNEVKSNEEYQLQALTSCDNTEDIIVTEQYDELLRQAIDQLPPQQKLIFQLSRYENLTHEQIAQKLNLSQGTVKNHLVRALGFLRKELALQSVTFAFLFDFLRN